ncbi:MAG: hypothetical protein GY847_04015 [Proteobacteria bacterium]|nr:hypothetical protein [Pseudomonadota bacterium]
MKASKSSIIALIVALMVISIQSDSFAIDFSKNDLERLEIGKTVKKPLAKSGQGGFFGGTGWALVDAPADIVWAALQDWDAYPDVFPRTVSTKELYRTKEHSLVHMELGYKILSVEYYLNVVRDPDKKMVSFTLVHNRPHDIEETRGYWRLFPQKDGRTLIAYAIAVQVPRGIVVFLGKSMEEEMEGDLIGLPKYIKRWVESPSGNRYRQMTAKK